VNQAATLAWFARHEFRLFWRDWVAMMTAGKSHRTAVVLIIGALFIVGMHIIAYLVIAPVAKAGITADKQTLVVVLSSIFLSCTMMISQAMESVTRAFYARDDLDLILSSPASARRVFAVRMTAITLSTAGLMVAVAGPFVNTLVVLDGPRWVTAYGVILALGALCTAFAIQLTVTLFRSLGAKRTRSVAQVVAAVIGAAFVIGIQAAAILSSGSFSRVSFLSSERFIAMMPDVSSLLWWPVRAAMGDIPIFAALCVTGAGLLVAVVAITSARFGDHVIAASGVSFQDVRKQRSRDNFKPVSTKRALRRKEWMLLWRDPWLLSQTLIHILYLLPPALLLWHNFGDRLDGLLVVVPVLVMASGQLAGGLAWLAVSGEDAPDLVESAPIPARAILAAKVEAVLGAVAMAVAPLVLALALVTPFIAAVLATGIAISAGSATMIQIWFRAQAKRSLFRRRQISSRLATLAEALSSILWAMATVLVAAESWFAVAPAFFAVLGLTGVWIVRPKQTAGV